MLPILEQLLVLQDRDQRIAQLRHEAARIPADQAAVDARIQAETQRLTTHRDVLKHVEADRKKLEVDADGKRAQILKWQGQLTQIKSNTEYQALLKEIAKAEAEIREIEDRELELMDESEKAQPALREEQAPVKQLGSPGATEQATLKQRAEAIEQELAKLEVDRRQLLTKLESDVVRRYERILRSKGDTAIVPVRAGNCGGCHLHLPPQVMHDVRAGVEVTNCDYCGRLLYWPGE